MKKVNELESYRTISVIILALLVVFYFTNTAWILVLAIELLVINLVYIDLNKIISFYWLKFAEVLGRFNSKLLLSLIFFLILTPLAFFYRLFNEVKTRKFTHDDNESYFEDVNKTWVEKDFIKQW
ncbi:hypothetical protein HYV31_03570 [candidate division WWE3 bacterium]|nr:hypothetical protein [candidate division WWE3 bacterium]